MTGGASGDAATGGAGPEPLTAGAVATLVGGRLDGDPDRLITGVAPLDRAGPTELSLFSHRRYASWFAGTSAGTVLVAPDLLELPGSPPARIVVDRPMDAMVRLLGRFRPPERRPSGVHPTAVVAPTATLGRDVAIEAYAVVGEDVVVGDGSWIGAHAVVEAGSRLGRDVRLHAHAVVYPRVEIGDRVVLHAGARVGREGFGFAPGAGGVTRIPHVGRCILEDDVEVGANSCVDRGSVDDTIIGAGTKLDNLVQVGHNVRMGRGCFVASQVGISGSSRIGDGVQVGGQAGVAGHLTIGDRATLAGRAAVFGDVPAGETWSGYPARPHREQLRSHAALARLARIIRPLEGLLDRDGTP